MIVHGTNKFCSSKEILSPEKAGANVLEVNTQIIMAFHEIGLGHEAVKTFCGVMNMPPPMNKKS